jgi:hypothetical protein
VALRRAAVGLSGVCVGLLAGRSPARTDLMGGHCAAVELAREAPIGGWGRAGGPDSDLSVARTALGRRVLGRAAFSLLPRKFPNVGTGQAVVRASAAIPAEIPSGFGGSGVI